MSSPSVISLDEVASSKKEELCWWFASQDYYTSDEVYLLRLSFALIKEHLVNVGINAFTTLFDEYPSAFKVFVGKKVLPETRSEVSYSWETKQHSLRVFHAIEKSLNRITKPAAYRSFVRTVAVRHAIYGAHPNHIVSLIGCLRTAILDEIRAMWSTADCPDAAHVDSQVIRNRHYSETHHFVLSSSTAPTTPNAAVFSEEDATKNIAFDKVVAAWNKFLSALSLGIVSAMSLATQRTSDENDGVEDHVYYDSAKPASVTNIATSSVANLCSASGGGNATAISNSIDKLDQQQPIKGNNKKTAPKGIGGGFSIWRHKSANYLHIN